MNTKRVKVWAAAALLFWAAATASAQDPSPLRFSIPTPHPVNAAENTTTPSAASSQRQNPYLGSVPGPASHETIRLSLNDAIVRGLRYNLGAIESKQSGADARAARLRSLSALLPQITARARQGFDDLSYREIGLKLPPIPGLPSLPPTSGGFGYQDARIALTQSLYSAELHNRFRATKSEEVASALTTQDARDVIVLAVGVAYMQALGTAARLDTATAQLASAKELDQQIADRVKSEVAPEIDSLRAQVAHQTAEQRFVNVTNQLEKDKLTLGRLIGFTIDQQLTLTDSLNHPHLPSMTVESAASGALQTRSDIRSAEASVHAAALTLRAQRAQRLPTVSFTADYGAAGTNLANANQVYSLSAKISVPLYTGGRISADIDQAQSELTRRQAEFEDLKGRVAYDLKIAWLDLNSSESSVNVAAQNRKLAERALTQSQDRYANGVANYLEVVQAQETVTVSTENHIQALFSFNVSLISYARSLGNTEMRLAELLGGK